MAYTSPTDINASRGIISIIEYLNDVTEHWIGRVIMLAIFVIFTAGYLRSKNDDDITGALAVGSFASFVIGLLFWLIGFLDSVAFGVIIGITAVSTALLMLDRRGQ